jgi:hypothetical protein
LPAAARFGVASAIQASPALSSCACSSIAATAPHAHLDVDATLEYVARWVEVEREVHAHRHHVFRQATGHLVEAEARLRRCGSVPSSRQAIANAAVRPRAD